MLRPAVLAPAHDANEPESRTHPTDERAARIALARIDDLAFARHSRRADHERRVGLVRIESVKGDHVDRVRLIESARRIGEDPEPAEAQ